MGYVCFAGLCVAMAGRYFYDQGHKPPEHRVTIGQIGVYLTAFMSLQGSLALAVSDVGGEGGGRRRGWRADIGGAEDGVEHAGPDRV